MSEQLAFGIELRRLRQQRGLSLTELSKSIHYSKGYLSRIETGKRAACSDLARLCDEVLQSGGTLTTLLPGRPRTGRARLPRPAQLPADIVSFVGRDDTLVQLDDLMDARDRQAGQILVSAICGAAGVGKTALAVHWAHKTRRMFPDGQLFVNLRGSAPGQPPAEPSDALAAVLRALGVAGQDLPAEIDERAALYRSLLDGRQMVIVLDDAANMPQLSPLLPGTSSCPVLVTSRDPLVGLIARTDAHYIELDGLARDDAIKLVSEMVRPEPDLRTLLAAAIESGCSGLPLDLRLAAELAVRNHGVGQRELTILRSGVPPAGPLRPPRQAPSLAARSTGDFTQLNATAARLVSARRACAGPRSGSLADEFVGCVRLLIKLLSEIQPLPRASPGQFGHRVRAVRRDCRHKVSPLLRAERPLMQPPQQVAAGLGIPQRRILAEPPQHRLLVGRLLASI
jgi:transcriptional regulator with XRE-family HTH domain